MIKWLVQVMIGFGLIGLVGLVGLGHSAANAADDVGADVGAGVAVHRYNGLLDVRVIEPNDAQYILGARFKSPYSKTVDFKLRPYNGKATVAAYAPFYEKNNGDDKRAFNITNKYYFSLRIRESNDKSYTAIVKLYRRSTEKKIDINKPYHFAQDDFVLVEEQPIDGQFTIDNEYLFVDRVDLKLYIKLNFDIVFTRQEIIERFKAREAK